MFADCSIRHSAVLPAALAFMTMTVHEQPMLYSVDLRECEALATLTPDAITAAFVTAMERAGATVVQTLSHAFPGAGLTSVLILAESHAVIHTWPETGTVNIDIFSCSTRLKSLEAVNELGWCLRARRISVQEIPRADGHIAAIPSNARA
jgi:S-adenosylmethionine decarboxylase proenzyme